ncbi:LCP family protein [Streptomyces sp. NPDC090021]|uniref:LCP family protein n=1 Tax=Streptomyces sp. NPDC090021 TaxID=3365919 RepID=UPI00382C5D4F
MWRRLLWLTSALLLISAGAAYALYMRLDANLTTASVNEALGGDRPTARTTAQNILLIGSDSREGAGGGYGASAGAAKSDTLMLLHLSADRTRAVVTSFPRDSWVSIPACAIGGGRFSQPHEGKLNSAFALGSASGGTTGGAACAIKTLEHNTGIHIDHFIEIDFRGFAHMVDAVGGVPMCLPKAIDDKKARLTLAAGCHRLDGRQALGYARARYSLGDGSDIGRIGRQQQLLSALAKEVKDRKFDTAAMYRVASAVTKALTVDEELGGLSGLAGLGSTLQGIGPDRLTFVTVPNRPREVEVPSDKSNVSWRKKEADELFRALVDDVPVNDKGVPLHASTPGTALGSGAAGGGATARPASPVTVEVLNGSGVTGQAAAVARRVEAPGVTVTSVANAPAKTAQSLVRYQPSRRAEAERLARSVGIANVQEVRATTLGAAEVTVVTGTDYEGGP